MNKSMVAPIFSQHLESVKYVQKYMSTQLQNKKMHFKAFFSGVSEFFKGIILFLFFKLKVLKCRGPEVYKGPVAQSLVDLNNRLSANR